MSEQKKSLKDLVKTEVVREQGSTPSLQASVEKSRTRQKSYVLDLRIHSPASLGYFTVEGLDTAPALVRLAKVKGLDVIAVTDFYSGRFVDRVVEAARNSALTVVPGVVVRCSVDSCHDVTLLCLFSEQTNSARIDEFLRMLRVPEKAFGNRAYLLDLPLPEILACVEHFGGIAIPSRMDKTPQRMAVIPALVERYGFRAFDLAHADTSRFFKSRWPKVKFHFFSFSNANALAQVGSRTARVKLANPGFEGIKNLMERFIPNT